VFIVSKAVSCSAERTIGVDGDICLTAAVLLTAVVGYMVFVSNCAAVDDSAVDVELSDDAASTHNNECSVKAFTSK